MTVTHQHSTINKDPDTGLLVLNGISTTLIKKLKIMKPPIHSALLQNSFKALVLDNNKESRYNMVKFGTVMDDVMFTKVADFRKRIQIDKLIDVSNIDWMRVPVILSAEAFKCLYDEINTSPDLDLKDPEIIELNIMFNKIKNQFS